MRPVRAVVAAVVVLAAGACAAPTADRTAAPPSSSAPPAGAGKPITSTRSSRTTSAPLAANPSGTVVSTRPNANRDRVVGTTVSGAPHDQFAVSWAGSGSRIIVTTWGSTGCEHGLGRPQVTGVVGARSDTVRIGLEMPLTSGRGACAADFQSTDFTVDLPAGYGRDRPLTVELGDSATVELPVAPAAGTVVAVSTGVPTGVSPALPTVPSKISGTPLDVSVVRVQDSDRLVLVTTGDPRCFQLVEAISRVSPDTIAIELSDVQGGGPCTRTTQAISIVFDLPEGVSADQVLHVLVDAVRYDLARPRR